MPLRYNTSEKMTMKKGKLIVVDGLEGAGKSTIIKEIEHYLKPHVPDILLTREPGGTMVGEAVRTLIKTISIEEMNFEAELLLLYAARIQLLAQVIYPALDAGRWVIADRFELSSFAYQGGGRGLARDKIQKLSNLFLEGFSPDLTFFLDISPDQGLGRVKTRGEMDRIEQESLEFFMRVRNAYHAEIHNMPNVVCIDASRSTEQVKSDVLERLEAWLC